jgi:hypothetical protein
LNRTARRLRWALGLVGVVVILLVAHTGYEALNARKAFVAVEADLATLKESLSDGDIAAAESAVTALQQHADSAVDNTQGPGWWLTEKIPGVGRNVEAIRTVAGVTQRLAYDAFPGLVDVSGTLTPQALRPKGGRIPLARIAAVAPAIVSADEVVQDETRRIEAIHWERLAPALGNAVRRVQVSMAEAASVTGAASRAVQLAPAMLGDDGARRYLLVFQNNAELRSLGGIGGAFAVLTAKDGKLSLDKQGDATTIGAFDRPILPLSKEERALFGDILGRYPQNVTQIPDFPRAAELASAMWARKTGLQFDGVIATDPVALSYLLRGTGAIDTPGGGVLTADNAVDLLLSRVYLEIADPAQQNEYFATVAARVFDAVSNGQGDARGVMEGLSRAATEGRLLIWARRPDEQNLLDPTRVGGALEQHVESRAPTVGVYFNESTATKLNYFLEYETSLDAVDCVSAVQTIRATVKLRSLVPKDVSLFPDYVVGSGRGLAPRGHMLVTLYFYAPLGGSIQSVRVGDDDMTLRLLEHEGHQVTTLTVAVAPGQQRDVVVELLTGDGQTGDPHLITTPGARGDGVGSVGLTACRSGR